VSTPSTDQALHRLLDQARGELWDTVASAADGGKRFRPALVLAAHDALGGARPAVAAEIGAAVELLHTAFVIHDDVIDGDEVRRGRLNPSGTYAAQARTAGASPEDAAALGQAAGILAGDLALTAAVRTVALCGGPPDVVRRLLDLFDAALHTSAAGELADVRLSLDLDAVSLAESLAMEEQKTSAYSFALPLQAGAVLAGADEDVVARLGRAGLRLGVAFQLVDDLLGLFGDPGQTGKSVTSDLRARKQTPILVHARSTPEWAQIQGYLGRELTDDDLSEARRLLTASGSRQFVEELVDTNVAAAREVLDDLGISADVVVTPGAAGRKEVAA
jgi:geranylgeranyl diphosphate synthase type II